MKILKTLEKLTRNEENSAPFCNTSRIMKSVTGSDEISQNPDQDFRKYIKLINFHPGGLVWRPGGRIGPPSGGQIRRTRRKKREGGGKHDEPDQL